MKIFISGSISKKSLTEKELACIAQIVEGRHTILIGDADGVDKAVQNVLAEQQYGNVVVYFSGKTVRNNLCNWQTKQIPNPENLKGESCYQLKDKEMVHECDTGVMFGDGKSKRTKHNMDYMNALSKYHLVVPSKRSAFFRVYATTAEMYSIYINRGAFFTVHPDNPVFESVEG